MLRFPSIFLSLTEFDETTHRLCSYSDPPFDLQRDALMKAGYNVIYEEAVGGESTVRPELERNLVLERTQAGLSVARARGRAGGRNPKLDAKQIRQIKALLSDPNTCVAELAREYGVSRATLYKHCGVVQLKKEDDSSKIYCL